jgi:hypothetical protein
MLQVEGWLGEDESHDIDLVIRQASRSGPTLIRPGIMLLM